MLLKATKEGVTTSLLMTLNEEAVSSNVTISPAAKLVAVTPAFQFSPRSQEIDGLPFHVKPAMRPLVTCKIRRVAVVSSQAFG